MSDVRAADRSPVGQKTFGARISLIVGAIALIAGILAARAYPATGYEVSIYAATPFLFWVGVIVAFGSTMVAASSSNSTSVRRLALLLAGLAFVAIIGLPLIRGYEFHGFADSLSHLGWVRDIAAGRLPLGALIYPGMHGSALFVNSITGGPLTRTLMLVPLIYVLLFAVGIALAVRSITADWSAVLVGVFSAFMLLLINNISAQMTAHPSTLAILFTPFVLAILIRYLRGGSLYGTLPVTAIGVILALCSVAITLLHPQQAVNLLLVFGAIAVIQSVVGGQFAGLNRSLYAQVAFLGGVIFLWSIGRERIIEAATGISSSIITLGGPSSGMQTVSQRGESLLAIGASLEEIFLKLFLVSAIFLVLTVIAILAALSGKPGERHGDGLVIVLGIAFVPVGLLFLLYLFAGTKTMYFRHFGFLMVLVTILGAIGFRYLTGPLERPISGKRVNDTSDLLRVFAFTVIMLMLLLSILTIYQSAFMYKPTMHVTEQVLSGHETSFKHADPEMEFYGIREGPDRYRDATTGTGKLDSSHYRQSTGVSGEVLAGGLQGAYDNRIYLIVTRIDRLREGVVFRNLRYSDRALSNIGGEPGVDRVMTNGEFELFVV